MTEKATRTPPAAAAFIIDKLDANTNACVESVVGCLIYGLSNSGFPTEKLELAFDVFVESSQLQGAESLAEEMIDLFRGPIEAIELLIIKQQKMVGSAQESIEEENKRKAVLFAIGTHSYCQAVMHYASVNEAGTCDSWGVHFMRNLAGVDLGQMAWMIPASQLPHVMTVADPSEISELIQAHLKST